MPNSQGHQAWGWREEEALAVGQPEPLQVSPHFFRARALRPFLTTGGKNQTSSNSSKCGLCCLLRCYSWYSPLLQPQLPEHLQVFAMPPLKCTCLIWSNFLHIHCAVLVLVLFSVAQLCLTLCDPMDCSPPGSSTCGDSPGKNTGVGRHVLLQGIFQTQGLNPGLPHCRQILYCLSHQESPWILECVAYFFSRGSSRPRNWTKVSYITGRFFTSWATRETHIHYHHPNLTALMFSLDDHSIITTS